LADSRKRARPTGTIPLSNGSSVADRPGRSDNIRKRDNDASYKHHDKEEVSNSGQISQPVGQGVAMEAFPLTWSLSIGQTGLVGRSQPKLQVFQSRTVFSVPIDNNGEVHKVPGPYG
jgi:hypothetical protein